MFINLRMADVFKPILDLFSQLAPLVNDEYVWYAVYFFGFATFIYQISNTLIQKILKGKAGKALAWLVTVTTIGSAFYGLDVADLLKNVDTLAKSIASLAIGISAMIYSFNYFKENRNKENSHFAYIILFVGLSLSSSLLMNVLGPSGYFVNVFGFKLDFAYSIIALIGALSMAGLFGYLFWGIFSIFKGGKIGSSNKVNKYYEKHNDKFTKLEENLKDHIKKGNQITGDINKILNVMNKEANGGN